MQYPVGSFARRGGFLMCALLLLMSPFAHADAPSAQVFNISPQAMSSALTEFARESQRPILFAPDVAAHKRSGGVRGTLEPIAALRILLKGSGLSFSITPAGAILIAPPDRLRRIAHSDPADSGAASDHRKASRSFPGRFRMAQVDQGPAAGVATVDPKTGGTSREALQEVIVTAQKYRQRAFDVPISLQVFNSQDLENRRITNLENLQFYVPGLWVQDTGQERRIVLQGISNIFGNGPLVGEYLDDADITPESYAANYGYGQLDPSTYDIQRVEVLRGPQGTLYGDGSMGGTIRFITNRPVLYQFQMRADVSASLTQYGAPSQTVDTMLNIPLVQDQLGIRLVGEFAQQGGWIDQPAANIKNFNSENLVDVRAEALWTPTSRFRLNATEIIHRNAYGLNIGEDAHGNYTQSFNQTTTPNGQENYDMSNITWTYDFGWAQLLSSSTYFNVGRVARNVGSFVESDQVIYYLDTISFPVRSQDVSEEMRLTRAGDGPWQWTLGGFYKRFSDNSVLNYYFGLPVAPGTPLSSVLFVPDFYTISSSKSWSAFGDTSYKLFERLTIGAGVRYFRDAETENTVGSPYQSGTFTSTDPRFYLQYRLTENVNTYASAGKGFRSGGFNADGQPAFQPESVWTYQLGAKTRFLEGHLRADADVYLTHYSKYVIVGILPFNPTLGLYSNAGNVRIKGVEGDLAWKTSNGWLFGADGDYTDAKFVSIGLLDAPYGVGEDAPGVPKYMFTLSAERDFKWNDRPAFARVDYSQTGRMSGRDTAGNPLFYSDVIRLLSFNTGIQWNDNLKLGFFAQNLLNNRGHLDWQSDEGFSARPRPRTVGVSFGVSFE